MAGAARPQGGWAQNAKTGEAKSALPEGGRTHVAPSSFSNSGKHKSARQLAELSEQENPSVFNRPFTLMGVANCCLKESGSASGCHEVSKLSRTYFGELAR